MVNGAEHNLAPSTQGRTRIVPGGQDDFNCAHQGLPNFLYLPPREWPRLPSTARIERAQFYRARSASKEGTWPLPSSSFVPPDIGQEVDGPGGGSVLDCARPTRAFSSRALREQENTPAPWPQITPSNTASLVPRSTHYSCPTPPPPPWPSPHTSPPGEQQSGAPARPTKWQTGAAF